VIFVQSLRDQRLSSGFSSSFRSSCLTGLSFPSARAHDGALAAGRQRIFSEKVSSRIKARPRYDKVLTLAHDIKGAAQP
jgi:hypothetical protein